MIGSHKTTCTHVNGEQVVTYHNTPIVRFDSNQIILNSGGWRTPTTKKRMNQTSEQFGLGFVVFQKRFDWFVQYGNQTLPFEDGLSLSRR